MRPTAKFNTGDSARVYHPDLTLVARKVATRFWHASSSEYRYYLDGGAVDDKPYREGDLVAVPENHGEVRVEDTGNAQLMDMVLRLRELEKELASTTDALLKAVQIKKLCPYAFRHGACTIAVEGNVLKGAKGATFIIVAGNRIEYQYPLNTVPYAIWPESVREEYEGRLPRGALERRKARDGVA